MTTTCLTLMPYQVKYFGALVLSSTVVWSLIQLPPFRNRDIFDSLPWSVYLFSSPSPYKPFFECSFSICRIWSPMYPLPHPTPHTLPFPSRPPYPPPYTLSTLFIPGTCTVGALYLLHGPCLSQVELIAPHLPMSPNTKHWPPLSCQTFCPSSTAEPTRWWSV
jgi:hypothetical protein